MTETTESKHTPGPWKAERRGDSDVNGREWEVRNEAREPITGWGCVRQTEANARLIAAAPDLLAACREALDFCEGILARYYIQEMYNNLELAIAKAEGVPDDELQRRRAAVAKATGEKL